MAKHHYLPRFYLANFTDLNTPVGQEPFVWVLIPGGEWKKRAPRNVAAKAGYYAVPDADGRKTEDVERLFALAEGVAASIIQKKVLKQKLLNAQQRAELATFIGIIHSRVPGMLDHAGEYIAEVARRTLELSHEMYSKHPGQWEAFKERYRRETGKTDLDEAQPEDLDPSHVAIKTETWAALAMTISGAGLFGQFLSMMDWEFLVSRGADYFITSDYPVGIVDPVTGSPSPGLASRGVEVTFPLSRHIALLAHWSAPPEARTAWHDGTSSVGVEEINKRTALRARLLVAPMPSFPGVAELTAQSGPVAKRPDVIRLHEKEEGFLIKLESPPARPLIGKS